MRFASDSAKGEILSWTPLSLSSSSSKSSHTCGSNWMMMGVQSKAETLTEMNAAGSIFASESDVCLRALISNLR